MAWAKSPSTPEEIYETKPKKHKTLEEIENKAEAKRACRTQDKLFRKIILLIKTNWDHNNKTMLPGPTAAVSDSKSDNNNANPIHKVHTFVKDVTDPHYPKSTRHAFPLSRQIGNQPPHRSRQLVG